MIDLLLNTGIADWGPKVTLFLLAFVKFFVAAIVAMPMTELSFWDICIYVGGGALISVVFYTYFGRAINYWIRKNVKRKKSTSFARRRKMYNFWKKYGLVGAAAMAPFISPMASVGIAVAFQERPKRIILYTGLSIIGWTLIFGFFREGVMEIVDWARALL